MKTPEHFQIYRNISSGVSRQGNSKPTWEADTLAESRLRG